MSTQRPCNAGWGGRTPRARHRAKIADALQRDEHDLWPDVTEPSAPSDDRRELAGIYAHANDVRVPDWRTLLHDPREQIDLLDYTLTDIIGSPGVTNLLTQKAGADCRVRVLTAHPKSIWVTSLAQQLGQDRDADGNTEIDRDISLSHGHLEPLVDTKTSSCAPSGPREPTPSCASTTRCSSPCTSTQSPAPKRRSYISNDSATTASLTNSPAISRRPSRRQASHSSQTPPSTGTQRRILSTAPDNR
jgi:hypothetical protein